MRVHRAAAIGAAVALNIFAMGILGTPAAIAAASGESTISATAGTVHSDEMGYDGVSPNEMGYD